MKTDHLRWTSKRWFHHSKLHISKRRTDYLNRLIRQRLIRWIFYSSFHIPFLDQHRSIQLWVIYLWTSQLGASGYREYSSLRVAMNGNSACRHSMKKTLCLKNDFPYIDRATSAEAGMWSGENEQRRPGGNLPQWLAHWAHNHLINVIGPFLMDFGCVALGLLKMWILTQFQCQKCRQW